MNDIQVIQGIEGYEENGVVYLRLETVARGLGFTQEKNGQEYIRWETVTRYLEDLGFSQQAGKDTFIPENIFYRLAMKAKNEVAEAFQSKVADEIIPTIRRTGSYSLHKENPSLPTGALEGAKLIFELAGLKDNQLTLAVDKVYKRHLGYSALTAGEVELIAPTKRQLLTPTEIARSFGLSAQKVNDILVKLKFQRRVSSNYEPLEAGMEYAVMIDTNKRHSCGTPIRQLKWDSSILDKVMSFLYV